MNDKKEKESAFSHFLHHRLDISAIFTAIGIVLLFLTSISTILLAPYFTEKEWRTPTSAYQVQMYEVADPNFYVSSSSQTMVQERQLVHHIKKDFSLLAFKENKTLRIISKTELEKYITHLGEEKLKLTSQLLLLRKPDPASEMGKRAEELLQQNIHKWREQKENLNETIAPVYQILELYIPEGDFAFARATTDGIFENWIDAHFEILDGPTQPYHNALGVIYISNPQEYRIKKYHYNGHAYWRYDPEGESIASLEELRSLPFNFMSRAELIQTGEQIYAYEGCWYCHTDQTRTLIQDVVLNGSDSFPAPPSSPNEYVYQKITFPGTRRIGPDLSRVGIKRASRDWHQAHFWSPKTANPGSIMPSFKHFFDNDPSGVGINRMRIPNFQFEAIFQYLMTKGTRITPPNQAWWLGRDPINTLEIIESK
jgi:cytochrome c oxidase cbb3-type subunit II